MEFYSVAILEKQTNLNTVLRYVGIFLLLAFFIIAIIAFLRNRLDTRYRDLSIIVFLSLLLISGVQYMDYSQSVTQKNQASEVLNFIKVVCKKEHVKQEDVFINSFQLTDHTIVKLEDTFYSVDFTSDKSAYSLKEVTLLNEKIIEKK